MTHINLYSTIFKRKSIRKYDLTPLDDEMLIKIKEFVEGIVPLYKEIKTEMRIVAQDGVNKMFAIKAPHYLVITSENKEGYLTNAGYIFQLVDLFLSSNGIGSCYLGMAMPTKATKEESELEFVMAAAFGNAAEPLHRTDVSQFKRKSLEQIIDIANNTGVLEPARLAPSAINSQPWYFTGDDSVIHAYCIKSNILKAIMFEKMNKFNMGIALCHLAVAAKHLGKQVSFICDTAAKNNNPKGYYYIASAVLS